MGEKSACTNNKVHTGAGAAIGAGIGGLFGGPPGALAGGIIGAVAGHVDGKITCPKRGSGEKNCKNK